MASQAAKVLSIAKSEEGYREGFSGGHWNNRERYAAEVPGMTWVSAGEYPWCALFISWVAMKAGVSDLYPRSASCSYGVNWFRQKGRWSEYPAIGAQVFFGADGGTHTGLVVAFDASTITTVEGNTNTDGSPEGNGVYVRKRNRRGANTYGYGLPAFAEGVTTADPSLKGKLGYRYAAKASAPVSSADASSGKQTSSKTRVVTVKAGQTLGLIAASAGISVATVLSLNPGIKNPDVILPGQKVTVPATPPKATTKPSPKPTAGPKQKPKAPAKTSSAANFPGVKYFGPGANNAFVTKLGRALVKHGYGRFYAVGPGPRWSDSDKRAVKAFQQAQGWSGSDADGIPGPSTWARLMK
ncbi:peptidoglycan-binding protein [Streptomyces decoyicus]|uniref:peptidoglycan-binding protein n=1 Tax=Streptomyces decoyicus TaxID=249567 RepID=UPI00363E2818